MARAAPRQMSPSIVGELDGHSESYWPSGEEGSESIGTHTTTSMDEDEEDEEEEDEEEGTISAADGATQSEVDDHPSPAFILGALDDLNEYSGRLLKMYLKQFKVGGNKGDAQFIREWAQTYKPFEKLFDEYRGEQRCIDPRAFSEILGIKNELDKVVWKANLAAVAHMASQDSNDRDWYFKSGGLEEAFVRHGGCAFMDDDANEGFITAWRTQLYIRSLKVVDETQNPPSADCTLLGIFFYGNYQMDASLENELPNAQKCGIRGWQPSEQPPSAQAQLRITKRVQSLHDVTGTWGTGLSQADTLQKFYPFDRFQEHFFEWLNIANKRLADSYPSLHSLVLAADTNKEDPNEFKREIQRLTSRAQPEPTPGQTGPHNFSTSSKPDPTGLAAISDMRRGASLKPPSSGPEKIQSAKTAHPPTPSVNTSTGTAHHTGFSINQLLNAAKLGNKENKEPTKKRFIDAQEGARRVSFDEAAELGGTSVSQTAQRPAADERPSDNDIVMNDAEDDEDDFGPPLPTAGRQRRVDHEAKPGPSRTTNRIARSQQSAKATYPQVSAHNDDSAQDEDPPRRPPVVTRYTDKYGRRVWSERDKDQLIKAIGEIGISWANIRDV
ncbi:hypothetical protein ABW21_db0200749 [Orbilia brochopaga]|nr:hypothetical protein ABW21_db0200749 [Drechslerella brochopaga]